MAGIHWSEVIGIFGGTFDPLHLGHVVAIRGVLEDPGLKRVIIVPSAAPPVKAGIASALHRLAMVEAGLGGDPRIVISPIELRQAAENPAAPTYSFTTIEKMRREFGNVAFVLGSDQLLELHQWFRFPKILELCHWVILERKCVGEDLTRKILGEWSVSGLISPVGDGQNWQITQGGHWIRLTPTEAPMLSSTVIREHIARTGNVPPGALPLAVETYLYKHHLYGIAGAES